MLPNDPVYAMYKYTEPPIRYAIKTYRTYCFVYGNYLNTGMKNPCIENA